MGITLPVVGSVIFPVPSTASFIPPTVVSKLFKGALPAPKQVCTPMPFCRMKETWPELAGKPASDIFAPWPETKRFLAGTCHEVDYKAEKNDQQLKDEINSAAV